MNCYLPSRIIKTVKLTLLLPLLVTLFFLYGCNQEKPESIIERIDLSNISECIVEGRISVIKIIQPEFNSSSVIGGIRKIEFFEDNVLIKNSKDEGELLLYDLEGKFIGGINRQGQGPGEYIELRDFTINYEKNEILILDNNDKVHFFDMNLKYLRSINIAKEFDHRRISSQKDWIYTSVFANDGKNLCISDYDGFFLGDYFSSPRSTFSIGRPFNNSCGSLTMKVKARDTIYELVGDSYVQKLLIDFGDKHLPHEEALKTSVRKGVPTNIQYALNTRFFEIDRSYAFNMITYNYKIQNDEYFLVFSDKKNSKIHAVKKSEFGDHLVSKGIVIWNTFADKYYCTILYPAFLHSYLKDMKKKSEGKIPAKYLQLKEMCDNYPIDGNPLVVIFDVEFNKG